MPRIPDEIASAFIDGAVDLSQFTESVQSTVAYRFAQLERKIAEALEQYDVTLPGKTEFRRARLQALLQSIKATTDRFYSQVADEQQGILESVAALGSRRVVQAVNTAVGVDLLSTALTPEQAKSIASNVMIDGARSSTWWKQQQSDLVMGFKDEVRQGMAAGETLTEIRNRIMDNPTTRALPGVGVANQDLRRVRDQGTKNVIKTARRNAASLVRSSVQVANNDAHMATFEANQDVVQGVIWLSTLDTRTTLTCVALDKHRWKYDHGKLVPVGHDKQFPGPTAHWGCRSTQIPWLRPWSDFIKDPKIAKKMERVPEGKRASMDGPVSNTLDYESWLKAQPEERQLQVLGRDRFKLYKDGKITSFDQLISPNGNPITLDQLAGGIKRKTTPAPLPFIDPKRPGANAWAQSWHDVSWAQDWMKSLVNTFEDPVEELVFDDKGAKAGSGWYRAGKPPKICMGTYTQDKVTSQGTWVHEYGHHMDRVLGEENLKRIGDQTFGQFKTDGTPKLGSRPAWDISASPMGQAKLRADDKALMGRVRVNQEIVKKHYEPGIVPSPADTYGWCRDEAYAQISKIMKDMEARGVNLKEEVGTVRMAAKEWLGARTDDFSKLALNLIDRPGGDPTGLVAASLSGSSRHQLEVVKRYLPAGNERFLNDLLGSITKNKIGSGHADSYYASYWAYQGNEAFANTVYLANLGPWGEQIARFFSPNFSGWVLDMLHARAL